MKNRILERVSWLPALLLGLAGRPEPAEAVPFYAEDVVDPNLLVIVDTSGSMTFDTYGCAGRTYVYAGTTYTLRLWVTIATPAPRWWVMPGASRHGGWHGRHRRGGRDVRGARPGTPNPPSVTLDGLTNDSRLFTAKGALNALIPNTEGVRFALARYFQTQGAAINLNTDWYRIGDYADNPANRVTLNYNWPGDGCAQSASASNNGKLLVAFPAPTDLSNANVSNILTWMDGTENFGAGDFEIRARGATPIGGILTWTNTYLNATKAADTAACRKSYALLITDGNETCGGNNPVAAATTLHNSGCDVFVIGFAIAQGQASINAIAVAGGTDANADNDDNPATGNAVLRPAIRPSFSKHRRTLSTRSRRGTSAGQPRWCRLAWIRCSWATDMPGWKGHFGEICLEQPQYAGMGCRVLLETKAASSRTMYTAVSERPSTWGRVDFTTGNAGSLSSS